MQRKTREKQPLDVSLSTRREWEMKNPTALLDVAVDLAAQYC